MKSVRWYLLIDLFATSTHFIETRQKHRQFFGQKSKLMTNPAILNALAHDAKLVLSFRTPTKYHFTDHFTCTSANVIYCITCTYCKKICIGETGRRLGDRFREHLRDVERNDKDASKPVARHFNLPNHSKQHMAICGLSLHLGNSESRKTLEQKFIFQIRHS